ncbi:MAG: S1 RNA-binding domain-containing protein [Anaerolineales bacterium]|nr:S1 RNA-binding domain-containing protein [Anaerolineales bacterium]
MEQHEAQNGQGAAASAENPQTEQIEQVETNTNLQSMEALLENEAFSIELPSQGEIRTGTIASLSTSQILVSIGTKSEGLIIGRELDQIPPEEIEALEVGQEVPVYVVNPEDANGNVILSYTRAREQINWDEVEELQSSDQVIDSKVSGYNKGGLIVTVKGLRGFVPASQVGVARRSMAVGDTPEQRWGKMAGEEISVRIIEVDRERRRLILSERAAGSESRQAIKERVIEDLEEGKVYKGRVTSLADFGAFVNINGADGLVHLSELSWDHIDHPRDVLEVGQEVDVKVIGIDRDKKRIGLSIRQLSGDPWKDRVEKFKIGDLVEGVITRLTKFGAFARLESDIEGLIHISELSEQRIEHPKEVLKEGDVVNLRIIRIDPDQHRIGLSLRKVDSAAYVDKDMKMLAEELMADDDEASEDVPVPEEKLDSELALETTAPAGEEIVGVEAAQESAEPVAEEEVKEVSSDEESED